MRNHFDFVKVPAIVLVVLGHVVNHYTTPVCAVSTRIIYLFHMPLFMALSGAIFAIGCEHSRYDAFVPFVANKTKRILVPFFGIGLLALAPVLCATGVSQLGIFGTSVNILIGGEMIKHLWYLQSLYLIFICAWCSERLHYSRYVALAVSIIVAVGCSLLRVHVGYLSIDMAIQFLPFLYFGMCLNKGVLSVRSARGGAVAILMMGIWLLMQKLTGLDLIRNASRFVLPCLVVYVLVHVGGICYERMGERRLLTIVLRNSFAIYLLHMPCLYVLRSWGIDRLPLAAAIVLSFVVALTCSAGAAEIIRRTPARVLIGEGK